MRRRRNDIKNEIAYFNKVNQNMDRKEKKKQTKIEKNEVSIEERPICNDFMDNFDLEKELTNCNMLGWIDMIENPKLYVLVKSLSLEEQTLLSYIFVKEKNSVIWRKFTKYGTKAYLRKLIKLLSNLKNFMNLVEN